MRRLITITAAAVALAFALLTLGGCDLDCVSYSGWYGASYQPDDCGDGYDGHRGHKGHRGGGGRHGGHRGRH